MSEKIISIPSVGEVSFFTRKGSKSVRLRVDDRGKISVTMPPYMPYKIAEQFVRQHEDWLVEQQGQRVSLLSEGMRVGRVHILRFVYDGTVTKPTVRATASQVIVRHASTEEAPDVQAAATSGAVRALRREAQHFLPKRLADLAAADGYTYNGVSIKQLKGRWGSCDSKKHITLNLYLMQLPIEYIDYVIYHELAHTRAMNHGSDFWEELEAHLPHAREMRKRMKQFQPTVPATKA